MIAGKVIGVILGAMVAGPFGALLGLMAGHFFDKGLGQAMGFDYQGNRAQLQQLFFETVFKVMGHLAKADGRISEEEISQAEQLMTRLGLSSEHRQQAIELFKQGAQPEFNLQQSITQFVEKGGRSHNLPALLLEFLFSIAMADGELHPSEKEVLANVASYLGIGGRQFEQLLAMLMAQQHFHQGGGGQQQSSAGDLEQAYQALGVEETVSDKELKQAYRKLMSAHHPDKLIAQGVPEDMMKVATEKAQEIQAAYELIKKSRK
ncbi:co-chaperone DjlA [Dasania sp. GY-MA-18]|uniref:Co-chaperone protein DjlA n=1 Tax=Dasania phycosphaerae TaxID=2950436 RepID=A0A9J6RJ76_9GAMM|nr:MULTISPECIES: co-chaperone DjlA [Dasania]MCR8921997.1 co-chaperone DjlA [Dasania sp. GY-MA-18]MCZ0864425.1 co-chaperone DjlA [Dasania phycosphaerae]MCZ0868153.1 co-chaperone DjlA [Dasania phycosphaerae]